MRAHARAPSVLVPAVPTASAGRHAKTGDSGEDAEFGFSQPFPVGQPRRGSSTSAGRSWSTLAERPSSPSTCASPGARGVLQTW
jgi:hypothetical protein